jgi:hypothetical protein
MLSDSLQYLPSSITRLRLADDKSHNPVEENPAAAAAPRYPVQLQQLTALLQLQITCGAVLPVLLAGLPQLQQVVLHECRLLSSPDADNQLQDGGTALLDVLSQLKQLQHLGLSLKAPALSDVSPQHFSALTASSQLTHLELEARDVAVLPLEAVHNMFPRDKQLPQLRRVYLAGSDCFHPWGLDRNDLARIVGCCPALMGLKLLGVVAAETDVKPLLQLPQGCTALEVAGVAFGNDAAAVVQQLSQLRELSWLPSTLTDLGLQLLTALTQLERLTVHTCGLTEGLTNMFDPPGQVLLRLRSTDSQVRTAAAQHGHVRTCRLWHAHTGT